MLKKFVKEQMIEFILQIVAKSFVTAIKLTGKEIAVCAT